MKSGIVWKEFRVGTRPHSAPIYANSSHYKSLPLYAAETPLNHSVGVGLQQGPEMKTFIPSLVSRERMFPSMFVSYANSPCENTVNESAPKCLFSPFSVQQKSPMVTLKVSLKWPRQVAKWEKSLYKASWELLRAHNSFYPLKDLSTFPLIGDQFVPKKEIFAKLIHSNPC